MRFTLGVMSFDLFIYLFIFFFFGGGGGGGALLLPVGNTLFYQMLNESKTNCSTALIFSYVCKYWNVQKMRHCNAFAIRSWDKPPWRPLKTVGYL